MNRIFILLASLFLVGCVTGKYVGEYKYGKRHGQGTYTSPSGDKYVGEWKDGKMHGQGTHTGANGDKSVGEWKDGEMHGQGIYTTADGAQYVGEFKQDKANGQGTYTLVNGDEYVGEFKGGKRHGHGTYTWTNGAEYVGEFKHDRRDGHGSMTWADGSMKMEKFVGLFKDDEPWYGFGYAKDGEVGFLNRGLPSCVSDFFDNCFAEHSWKDGTKYEGEWKDNKMHGHGIFISRKGNMYIGEFKDHKQHGQGTATNKLTGGEFVGEWKNAEPWTGFAYDKDGIVIYEMKKGVRIE